MKKTLIRKSLSESEKHEMREERRVSLGEARKKRKKKVLLVLVRWWLSVGCARFWVYHTLREVR